MVYGRIGYDRSLQDQVLAFMALYGEYSETADQSLEEGDEFVLTYLRNGRTPVTWQSIYEHLNGNPGKDAIHEIAERETLREAIIARLEAERQFKETITHFQ